MYTLYSHTASLILQRPTVNCLYNFTTHNVSSFDMVYLYMYLRLPSQHACIDVLPLNLMPYIGASGNKTNQTRIDPVSCRLYKQRGLRWWFTTLRCITAYNTP